jgi:RHS repeat-associated protein
MGCLSRKFSPVGGSGFFGEGVPRLGNIANSFQRLLHLGVLRFQFLGRRTSLTRPNGVNTAYNYDTLSRLLSVLHQMAGSTIDGSSYTYDAVGNRTSKTALPSVTSAYSYDPAYELTQVLQGTKKTEAYTYDAVGNRTYQPGVPYTYNNSNEMLTREGVPYTYDANGNTISRTNGNGMTTYAWDSENRLSSATTTSGAISFTYDPFGRRIRKASPAGTTIYVYDGNNIEQELNADGSLGERYTYGPSVDEPLVGQRQPKIFYYEADGLGSVTSLTDPTGAVAATYTYDSSGFLTNSTGSATNWFRYTARQFGSDTALYYYRARYYDPTVGRFLSEDPIRFDGGANFYRYAANNPVNLSDPYGLCPPKTPCAPSGNAPPPGFYRDLANSAGWIENDIYLYEFHRGGFLDAQVQYGGSQAYANYVFGVYMASGGYSLSTTLSTANAYGALFSHYPAGTNYDPNYTNIPASNVANISQGFNDALSGMLCDPY